jgi:hypothetical protein
MRAKMTEQEIIDDYAREDNEMLVRRFVAAVGHDYVEHDHKHTSQIHPDFSKETKIIWKEIESRLNAPTVLNFDRDKCLSIIREQAKNQAEMCKQADYTSSYHYGLKQAHYEDIRTIEECIIKETR